MPSCNTPHLTLFIYFLRSLVNVRLSYKAAGGQTRRPHIYASTIFTISSPPPHMEEG